MLETEVKSAGAAGGKYYVVHRDPNKASRLSNILTGISAYLALLGFFYGMLSFNRPEVIEKAFENRIALVVLVLSAGALFVGFGVSIATLGTATFEKITGVERVNVTTPFSSIRRWAIRAAGGELTTLDSDGKFSTEGSPEARTEPKENSFSYAAFSNDTPFEGYISNIVQSLSAYAASSEITATKLLDKGVAFMAGGLVFYVLAIIVWQIFANLTHPDTNVMYVGMAACSMTFVIVEFLAAWFFKQYRYYVEVSLSCLRVRSVYDRYLLGCYALREFKGEADENARNKMTEILKEDVGWPDYKRGVANDFNYMVESMGVAHATMEKIRGVFESKKKQK